MIYTCTIETPLGLLLAAVEEDALIGLWFTSQKHYPKNMETWIGKPDHRLFTELKNWLEKYFKGEECEIKFPMAPKGTGFQKIVWKFLLEIPYGQTTTYGAIAKKVAAEMGRESMSAQAVGGAIGRNPISISIPCHRVIGADKNLTGYDGGLDKKEILLNIEKAVR
ncbi:methylated-DNA--[protein]-cysteine S-methyltransferase [Clostridium sp.]|uniref:methylated-DNA--[protein]-cysteine S-methyltransferase n=1 Tax=Clostridium sp. TaxID=1506 RepID=UPI001A3F39FE|nr:methylated-DNA--[protein]-cysteine S-methyltransferase [Clostridium sp.]MBK5236622.1 methylated-DNA--[protein]-cysteine S-methyltransferase [Clostridium sp.]